MMCSAMQSTGYLEEEEDGRATKEEKEHSNNRKLRRSVLLRRARPPAAGAGPRRGNHIDWESVPFNDVGLAACAGGVRTR
ncbi:unnamed protein product [Boreogadus saida]